MADVDEDVEWEVEAGVAALPAATGARADTRSALPARAVVPRSFVGKANHLGEMVIDPVPITCRVTVRDPDLTVQSTFM